MQTKTSNDLSNKNVLECLVPPKRMNRAVKNAHKLYLLPIIFNKPDANLICIDGSALEKLNEKCSVKELEMFKLLISGYNQTEVARKLNISQSNVSRKIAKLRIILSSSK